MKKLVTRLFTSYRATLILLALYAVCIAVATIIEKYHGSDVAKALIYYSPLLLLIQLFLGLNIIGVTISHRFFRRNKKGYLLTHCAFLVILLGAAVTHFTSSEGLLHIREGEKVSTVQLKRRGAAFMQKLPYEIELVQFSMIRYPGSQSPSSYESDVIIRKEGEETHHKIFMNNVVDIDGYRLFQASYDQDEKGTVLMVSRDETGRTITYIGYAMLLCGLLLMFFDKNSRIRRLNNELRRLNKVGVLLLFCFIIPFVSRGGELYIPPSHVKQFGHLAVQLPNGRIAPMSTFASEIVRKLYGDDRYKKMLPEEVLCGIVIAPAYWADEPIVQIDIAEIIKQFGLPHNPISYKDAFDDEGTYKFHSFVEEVYRKPMTMRTKFDKELLKLDEKINTLHQLFNLKWMRLFPNPSDSVHYRWYAVGDVQGVMTKAKSDEVMRLYRTYQDEAKKALENNVWNIADAALAGIADYQYRNDAGLSIASKKLELEAFYNRTNIISLCKKSYLIVGALLLLLTFYRWNSKKKRSFRILTASSLSALLVAFLMQCVDMGLRWYISGYAPWSNSYETMVLLALSVVFVGFLFYKKNALVLPLAAIFSGIILFVSQLSWMDPQISPLVPVLKSRWLMYHVAVLMIAYGFLGIGSVLSTANLILLGTLKRADEKITMSRIKQLTIIIEMALIIGLSLMTIGVFLGAIWANESWGRYWSWDPKETWALVTILVYAFVLHYRWFRNTKNLFLFNLLSQLSLLVVIMTYFGVNYLLSGMHSYGNTGGLSMIPWWVMLCFVLFFLLPIVLGYLGWTGNQPKPTVIKKTEKFSRRVGKA